MPIASRTLAERWPANLWLEVNPNLADRSAHGWVPQHHQHMMSGVQPSAWSFLQATAFTQPNSSTPNCVLHEVSFNVQLHVFLCVHMLSQAAE